MNRIFLLFFLALAVFSCKKYPEGPDFSLHSKKNRLTGTWIIEKEFENGVDKTQDFEAAYSNYSITITKDGTYVLAYTHNGNYAQGGSWTFNSDKTQVFFHPVDPVPDYAWLLLRLESKSLHVQYTDASNNTIKLQLVPQS